MSTELPVRTIEIDRRGHESHNLRMVGVNDQPPEKRSERRGTYDVHSVFHTIQGEGPFAGQPAVFVRLAGCNLQCPGCDTEYTKGRREMSTSGLFREIDEELYPPDRLGRYPTNLIVITGGEPFRQNLGELLIDLLAVQSYGKPGFKVQIETNGTLHDLSLAMIPDDLLPNLTIVCSPKARINTTLRPYINCLKYVMRAGEVDTDGLPTRVLGSEVRPERPWPEFKGKVYLQPMDEPWRDDGKESPVGHALRNRVNLQACIDSCMKYGYILSLQLHKIVGLP